MFALNPNSLFFSSNSTTSLQQHFPLSPSFLRCRAAAAGDSPAVPAFSRFFHFHSVSAAAADATGGFRLGQEYDGGASSMDGVGRSGGGNGGVKANAMEKKWSRNRESYLVDDSDVLPLPMTFPNSSPVSPDEIDRRLRCDPVVEGLFCFRKLLVVEIYLKRVKNCLSKNNQLQTLAETVLVSPQTLGCIGYVQKITARKDIEVMEDLDNGKPL